MEFQKIASFLDTTSDDKDLPRFVTKKWIEVYDQSGRTYNVNKEIRIKKSMLRSDLCDFSDAYIVVKGIITVTDPEKAKRNKALAFKNNAPFIKCFSKINGIQIDNKEDLDVVVPMYSLLEYNKNYRKTTGSLWNYYRNEPSNPSSSNSESFKYKTSITGITYNVGDGEAGYDADKIGKNETEVVIPLKHLSNFWRTSNISLINCEIELILAWSKSCLLADVPNVPNVRIKDLNVLIDGKSFFNLSVKDEEEAYEKIIEMSCNSDCTAGNLLAFAYFKENYRLTAIDLSKQTKLKNPQ